MRIIKNLEKPLSLSLSIIAIVLATLSYFHSKTVSERSLNLEVHRKLKEVSENLKLEFKSDSLYFTTVKPCPDETQEEKTARLTSAAIGIGALEALVGDKEESLIVFLKTVLLAQQGSTNR